MQEVPYGDLKLRALSDEKSSNLRKHQSKNPLQRVLINNFYRTLVSIIPNIEYKTILDVGCGEGFTINKLQKKFNADHYGFDISADAIEFLRNQGVQGEFKAGSLEDIQYSKKFDLVICNELLEHLKNPFRALKKICTLSNRYCVFSVPNEPLFSFANFLRGKNVRRFGKDPEHLQFWSTRSFVRLLSRYFCIVKVRKPFPWTMVLVEKKSRT